MTPVDLPRVSLAHLPTPLEPASRLGKAIGLESLWIKRDDCTGLALGGSKVRQLEFLLGDAISRGADLVIAHGSWQSNFLRLVAAAACKLGLKAVLLIQSAATTPRQGNLLLNEWFGADLRFVPELTAATYPLVTHRLRRELQSQGYHPYVLPHGGASGLGAVAAALAITELASQVRNAELRVSNIFVATGSGGTLAGMLLGVRRELPEAMIHGISVGPSAAEIGEKCRSLARLAARMLPYDWDESSDCALVLDAFAGPSYGTPSEAGDKALQMVARTEGLLLDPIYSAKAMAALIEMARSRSIDTEGTVVFWHTGGVPALFACGTSTGNIPG